MPNLGIRGSALSALSTLEAADQFIVAERYGDYYRSRRVSFGTVARDIGLSGLSVRVTQNEYDIDYISGEVFAPPYEFDQQAWVAGQTVTPGTTSIGWNLDLEANGDVTLSGDYILSTPTNMKTGGSYTLIVRQDNTGSRSLSFDSVYKFPGGTAPTLSTTSGSIDILTFISDGSSMYGVAQTDFR